MKGGTIFTRVCRFFVLLVTILTITRQEWITKHHQTNNNGYWIFDSEGANFYHPAVANLVVIRRSDVYVTMHVHASASKRTIARAICTNAEQSFNFLNEHLFSYILNGSNGFNFMYETW